MLLVKAAALTAVEDVAIDVASPAAVGGRDDVEVSPELLLLI